MHNYMVQADTRKTGRFVVFIDAESKEQAAEIARRDAVKRGDASRKQSVDIISVQDEAEYTRPAAADVLRSLGSPLLEYEISESPYSLDDIISAVEKAHPGYRFDRTEARYESRIMAVFTR